MTGAAICVLGLVLLAPVAALAIAGLLDIGPPPESPLRISVFPLALTVFDPLVWTSLWNSLVVAVLVACGSLVIGVPVGHVIARWRFWGRPLLSLLVMGPAVISPAYLALGVVGLSDSFSLQGWPWFAWVWSALVQGVALVAITTVWSLDGLDPNREAAARLAGAGLYRTWWVVTWPLIRPAVASAFGILLVTTLADPGAPLVLGLRRTLGFQVVADAVRPDAFPRIASLGLILAGFGLAARGAVRWWGGPSPGLAVPPGEGRVHSGKMASPAAWPRAAMSLVVVGSWALLAWLPIAGLGRLGLTRAPYSENPHPLAVVRILDFLHRLTEEDSFRLVFHSAMLGLGVAAVLSILAGWLPHDPARRLRRAWRSMLVMLAMGLPPLVLGVGVLALSRMAALGARLPVAGLDWPRAATVLESAARVLDRPCVPGFSLLLGVCLAYVPLSLLKRTAQPDSESAAARRVDQAIFSGASRARGRRLGHRGTSSFPARTIVLWATLAATSITPAIVLTPIGETTPIGPAIVSLSDEPDDSRSRAAALALAAITVNLAALAWAWSGRGRDRGGRLEAADLA